MAQGSVSQIKCSVKGPPSLWRLDGSNELIFYVFSYYVSISCVSISCASSHFFNFYQHCQ